MKTVRFDMNQYDLVLQGDLTATIRRYNKGRHDFKPGQRFYGQFDDGEAASRKRMLTATQTTVLKPLHRLTNAEAREAGFADRWDAQRVLKAAYGMSHSERVAIIRFTPLTSNR
jgi:hypothetical protein